jgi:hypothetical protein
MYVYDEDKLIEIFCETDDFCQVFSDWEQTHLLGDIPRTRRPSLSDSEIMTIIIFYHLSGFKCFKYYYNRFVCQNLNSHFPGLVSYNRFIELMPRFYMKLFFFTKVFCTVPSDEINYIDSAKLPVCHNLRIHSNRVFKDIAKRGKTSTGYFYGLKIHLIINDIGEVINFVITPGNVADNNKELLRQLLREIKGKVFGDKGYLTKIFHELYEQGTQLITKVRRNMKISLVTMKDKFYLNKRGVIESVIDILKSICNIDHTRHRSPLNAIIHILGGIAAYRLRLSPKVCQRKFS